MWTCCDGLKQGTQDTSSEARHQPKAEASQLDSAHHRRKGKLPLGRAGSPHQSGSFLKKKSQEYKFLVEIPQFQNVANECSECYTGQTKHICRLDLVKGQPFVNSRLNVTKLEGVEELIFVRLPSRPAQFPPVNRLSFIGVSERGIYAFT